MEGNVGYCPQFDALDLNLTATEVLYCYGRIKGIPEDELAEVGARSRPHIEWC